jgi:hypothetical protein
LFSLPEGIHCPVLRPFSSVLKEHCGYKIIGDQNQKGRHDYRPGGGFPHALGPSLGIKPLVTSNGGNDYSENAGFKEANINVLQI